MLSDLRPLEKLIDIYEKSVGGNATFLLNIPPTSEGLFHENDVQRLHEIGEYIRCSYGMNLADTAVITASPAAERHDIACVRTDDDNCYIPVDENGVATIELRWPEAQTIRRVVMKEQILLSQRVERFAIDAMVDGAWQAVNTGTVIGHKRIVVLDKVKTEALRIRIIDARVAPTVKFIGVYC